MARQTNTAVTTETTDTTTTETKVERPVDKAGRYTDVGDRENRLELFERFKNKSGVIRYLAGEKYSPGAIAKFLEIRYQHVRNVLVTPVKGAQQS